MPCYLFHDLGWLLTLVNKCANKVHRQYSLQLCQGDKYKTLIDWLCFLSHLFACFYNSVLFCYLNFIFSVFWFVWVGFFGSHHTLHPCFMHYVDHFNVLNHFFFMVFWYIQEIQLFCTYFLSSFGSLSLFTSPCDLNSLMRGVLRYDSNWLRYFLIILSLVWFAAECCKVNFYILSSPWLLSLLTTSDKMEGWCWV